MPLQATSGAASYDAFGGGVPVVPNYIEEVFQTWLYTGTGSAQTITNGIDFSTKGGLLWLKARNDTRNNYLYDTTRSIANALRSDSVGGQTSTPDALTAFNNNGFSIGTSGNINTSSNTLVSWSFRKQPKFFDVVTWTGDDASSRTITHNLGSVPGFIVVKDLGGNQPWPSYHRSLGATKGIYLSSTATSEVFSGLWNNTEPTSTQFTVGYYNNSASATYVAYLFAHDAGGFGLTGTDNVISCGSFTGNTTVNLGFEPQWILLKNSGSAENWYIHDTMRGWPVSGDAKVLYPNLSSAEGDTSQIYPNATGFSTLIGGGTYIYIAIRRGPMKVPTSGTSVFSPVAQAGNGGNDTITTGFPTDLVIGGSRVTGFTYPAAVDRLRGRGVALITGLVNADDASPSGRDLTSFASNTGYTLGYPPFATAYNYTGNNIYWNFRRAPSFFDIVCYSGTGTSDSSINHNLGVVPELFIVKRRNAGGSGDVNWGVYSKDRPSIAFNLILNSTTGWYNAGTNGWFGTGTLSSTLFPSGNASANFGNLSGGTYVAYLFATCPGVSKVGSYTGNGSTQTIDCGFGAGGARFVLIKRTDSTGGWYVYDTARGMTVLTDPYLFLNSDAAEVATLGSVTTVSTGFALNAAVLAAINVSSGTYIFLAIA
jgi:hypothetical protein